MIETCKSICFSPPELPAVAGATCLNLLQGQSLSGERQAREWKGRARYSKQQGAHFRGSVP